MILHPSLRLKKIAEMAEVSEGVLRVWRTQEEFKKAEKEACKRLGEMIEQSIDNFIRKEEIENLKKIRAVDPNHFPIICLDDDDECILKVLKSEMAGKKDLINSIISSSPQKIQLIEIDDTPLKNEDGHFEIRNTEVPIYFLTGALIYLDIYVSLPIIKTIRKKINYLGSSYFDLWTTLLDGSYLDKKTLRDWKRQPEILDFTKEVIGWCIDILNDPGTLEEERKKIAENLKIMISNELEILGK